MGTGTESRRSLCSQGAGGGGGSPAGERTQSWENSETPAREPAPGRTHPALSLNKWHCVCRDPVPALSCRVAERQGWIRLNPPLQAWGPWGRSDSVVGLGGSPLEGKGFWVDTEVWELARFIAVKYTGAEL